MPRYATETSVPVDRSKADIEQMVSRYGASQYISGWTADEYLDALRVLNKADEAARLVARHKGKADG